MEERRGTQTNRRVHRTALTLQVSLGILPSPLTNHVTEDKLLDLSVSTGE